MSNLYKEAIHLVKAEAATSSLSSSAQSPKPHIKRHPSLAPLYTTMGLHPPWMATHEAQRQRGLPLIMTGNPVIIFAVKGTIAAGDEPLPWIYYPQSQKGVYPCVEIMTGATFPPTSSSSSSSSTTSAPARDEHPFDCCVSSVS
ncbi:molybdenum cofactor biosynthesis protein [Blastomyces dermatitidis ATCC 18188]|uniref:Molybdenum cofactor biosynthesis protein n=1 Tax=Ajellomyces dermatitidis (strain ATCC 18188 / CBS 674.68) TaxID=653446 RepID=F2TN58_AJEDA|nr:molybdenum cofactor biosynthesis protein [Blastomyces dermatitidis ATCC 18188]